MNKAISTDFPFELRRMRAHDAQMAYVDVGAGDPNVFLHGNVTSFSVARFGALSGGFLARFTRKSIPAGGLAGCSNFRRLRNA
jgi:hypothetical protein